MCGEERSIVCVHSAHAHALGAFKMRVRVLDWVGFAGRSNLQTETYALFHLYAYTERTSTHDEWK